MGGDSLLRTNQGKNGTEKEKRKTENDATRLYDQTLYLMLHQTGVYKFKHTFRA